MAVVGVEIAAGAGENEAVGGENAAGGEDAGTLHDTISGIAEIIDPRPDMLSQPKPNSSSTPPSTSSTP